MVRTLREGQQALRFKQLVNQFTMSDKSAAVSICKRQEGQLFSFVSCFAGLSPTEYHILIESTTGFHIFAFVLCHVFFVCMFLMLVLCPYLFLKGGEKGVCKRVCTGGAQGAQRELQKGVRIRSTRMESCAKECAPQVVQRWCKSGAQRVRTSKARCWCLFSHRFRPCRHFFLFCQELNNESVCVH